MIERTGRTPGSPVSSSLDHIITSSAGEPHRDLPSLVDGTVDAIHDDVRPDDFLGWDGSRPILSDRVRERLHLLLEPVDLLVRQLRSNVDHRAKLVPVDFQGVDLHSAFGPQEVALS